MATLSAHGITAELPAGFEGRIFKRPDDGPGITRPVAQFATFPLPAKSGDFGAGIVNLMGPNDIFAVLFEYGPESLGRRLFEKVGMPRNFKAEHFKTETLRRGLPNHSGTQWFFTESARPFTFYAVLGNHTRRAFLVPRLNSLVSRLRIDPSEAVP